MTAPNIDNALNQNPGTNATPKMSKEQLRISALELASQGTNSGSAPANVIERARVYAEFLING